MLCVVFARHSLAQRVDVRRTELLLADRSACVHRREYLRQLVRAIPSNALIWHGDLSVKLVQELWFVARVLQLVQGSANRRGTLILLAALRGLQRSGGCRIICGLELVRVVLRALA